MLLPRVDVFFFFQAEDGIRDHCVTGVQTCALPILAAERTSASVVDLSIVTSSVNKGETLIDTEIGRASCRESVDLGGRRIIKKKKKRRTKMRTLELEQNRSNVSTMRYMDANHDVRQ